MAKPTIMELDFFAVNTQFSAAETTQNAPPAVANLPPEEMESSSVTTTDDCSVPPHPHPPLTIFYNGKVSVFHVSLDTAEKILKMAETDAPARSPLPPATGSMAFTKDLRLARVSSIRRFLERRKRRSTEM